MKREDIFLLLLLLLGGLIGLFLILKAKSPTMNTVGDVASGLDLGNLLGGGSEAVGQVTAPTTTSSPTPTLNTAPAFGDSSRNMFNALFGPNPNTNRDLVTTYGIRLP